MEGIVLGLSRRICEDFILRNNKVFIFIFLGMFGKLIEVEIKRKENLSFFRYRIDKLSYII